MPARLPPDSPSSSRLAETALEYLSGRLQAYGSNLSADHRVALHGLLWLAAGLAEGRLTGRYRFALPCGMGKTTGVRALLRAIAQLGLPHRITVACSKVEQLCRLKRQLIGEDGVHPTLIGLVHSYSVDARRAGDGHPGYASEPSEQHDAQFLLVTHARVRVDEQGEARTWVQGRENDLVLYDESLVVGQALTLPLLTEDGANLVGDCAAFETTALLRPEHEPAVRWIKAAVGALHAASRGTTGDEVRLVDLPRLTEAEAASYLRLRPMTCERFPRLASFIEQARDGVTFRVFVDQSRSRSLVSYTVSVPDCIQNMLVLDASDPIREIVHHDHRMMRAEDVVPCLSKFRSVPGGISTIKRYDRVIIYFARGAAGRASMAQEFGKGKASALVQKFLRVLKAHPRSKALAFTFKQRDSRDVDYAYQLREAARDAGVEPRDGIGDASGCGRMNVLTWGMETATNDYQACDVVALLGVIHQRTDVIAGQYLGQVDDIRAPRMASLVHRLVRAECLHAIYQAVNRGSMRRTEVVDGISQAAPCSVYVLHSDPDLREKLGRVLPGARWLPWREPGEGLGAPEVALKIADRLRQLEALGHDKVSLRSLKGELAAAVPNGTWQRARDEALRATPWVLSGRSLVRPFLPALANAQLP